jgi:hypothetical protein
LPISQLGAVNISALSVPQALVQIVPPQFLFNGVSTNTSGLVGTAAWGPVNTPMNFGNYSQFASIYGPTVPRTYDMGGHVILADAQGAGYFVGVRVTDGTDTAASVVVGSTGVTLTGKYTGSLGNSVKATFSSGTKSGSQKVVISAQNLGSETFDNIQQGVSTVTTVPGTTYTSVPACAVAAAPAGGVNAVINATLTTYGTGTLGAPGTGYAVNDLIYLANGVVIKVLTLATTAVATFSIQTQGTLLAGSIPTQPMAQVSTSGAGTGATFTLTWCLGAPQILNPGTGYVSAPTVTLTGGGGTGGSYTAVVSDWGGIAWAINNGSSSIRPASNIVVATVGSSTAAPTAQTVTLSGGTDGAQNISTSVMLGVDTVPRTGMYALRNQAVAQFDLCDLSDVSSFSTQIVFGFDIGAYAICPTPASDTISNAQTELAGIDSFVCKPIFGDWIIWNDTVNQVPTRITSPQAIALGLLGNLSPQNNVLNKPINGIVGTQSSVLGKTYSYSDFQTLAAARMDLIALDKTISNNFVFRLGLNSSSNPVTSGDEYTRVTFFLAKSIQIIAAKYIGNVTSPDDLRRSKVSLQTFLAEQQRNSIIGTVDGSQAYQVVLDNSNNTQITAALGYRYGYVKAIYQGITKYFIVNLEGGASVTISNTPPGQ